MSLPTLSISRFLKLLPIWWNDGFKFALMLNTIYIWCGVFCKMTVQVFCLFFSWGVAFFLVVCSVWYILDTNLCYRYGEYIQSVAWRFTFFVGSLNVVLNFNEINHSCYMHVICDFYVEVIKMVLYFFPMFKIFESCI